MKWLEIELQLYKTANCNKKLYLLIMKGEQQSWLKKIDTKRLQKIIFYKSDCGRYFFVVLKMNKFCLCTFVNGEKVKLL